MRDSQRPGTRAECVQGVRPCPFVSCRHHLFLDVKAQGGILFNFGADTEALHEVPHSCSLDVADEGGATRDEVAVICGVSRERVRQIERKGLAHIAHLFD